MAEIAIQETPQTAYMRGYINSAIKTLVRLIRITEELATAVVEELDTLEQVDRLIGFMIDENFRDLSYAEQDSGRALGELVDGIARGKMPWNYQLLLYYAHCMGQHRDRWIECPFISPSTLDEWQSLLERIFRLPQGRCDPPIPSRDEDTWENPVATLMGVLFSEFFVHLDVAPHILEYCDGMAMRAINDKGTDEVQRNLAWRLTGIVGTMHGLLEWRSDATEDWEKWNKGKEHEV